ncbi:MULTISPECIES: ABC transporter permease [unclassified Luteococcus]|uniref:ABC transporter permease n=1 Tax=unclassified Luteococcus TaxID=2639923 RepID=UPI00313B11F5
MHAYWELVKAGFRRHSRYRAAVAASVFTNTIFGLVRASMLLTAIHTAGRDVGGYSALQAATYVWLGQGLLGPLDVWGSSVTIGERVRSGDIAVDFTRPVSVLGAALATNYGRAAFELVPRCLPPLMVGALITGLYLPSGILPYLLGALSLILATPLCYCFYFAVSLSALWTVENRGFLVVAMVVQQVLCGFVVPVSWFPGWLQSLANASPFPAMFQTPVDMFTGRLANAQAVAVLGLQAVWLAVLVALCQLLLRAGRRKVVVQGG